MKKRKNQLKDGELSNNGFHRCRQTQCTFFRIEGCKNCDKCGAAPYEINEDCKTCWNCENVPNETRFGDKKKMELNQKMALSQEEQLALAVLAKGMEKRMENSKKGEKIGPIVIER